MTREEFNKAVEEHIKENFVDMAAGVLDHLADELVSRLNDESWLPPDMDVAKVAHELSINTDINEEDLEFFATEIAEKMIVAEFARTYGLKVEGDPA